MTDTYPLRAIGAIIAMTLLTLLAFSLYPQYKVSGAALVDTSADGFGDWQQSGVARLFSLEGDSASITLDRPGYNARLIRTITAPASEGPLHLQAELSARNIVAGEKNWENGALTLVREDANGKRLGSDTLISLEGSHDWRTLDTFVDIPAPTPRLSIVVRMLEAQGTLSVRQLRLTPAQAQAGFGLMHKTLVALWVGTGVWILAGLIRRYRLNRALLAIGLTAALTFTGTLMPKANVTGLDGEIAGKLPAAVTDTLYTAIDTILPGYLSTADQAISKFGHWLAFFSLTAIALLMVRQASVRLIVLAGLSLAAATETLQLLTTARTPHVIDVLIDAGGIATAVLLFAPLRAWLRQRRKVKA
ncbi:VanZ family protein [Granulosicoccaceae sp. 1_MG-2023]|nr:VanZ family protein [Granulosicoccaceae sp. 1_MG-2023]